MSYWAHPAFSQQGGLVSARIQGIIIQAGSMYRDSDSETVDLEKNVQIIFKDQSLQAERVIINLRSKRLDARGQVEYVTSKAKIKASRIILDYESNTGVIFFGSISSGNVLFEGEYIQKISEDEYLADDARFTSCTTCPEAWSFSGSKFRAEIGGYAYIKNSILRFGGFPVFWMPYLTVPLKGERQSGLLPPEFEINKESGLSLSQSVFWAINRSQDATFTVQNNVNGSPKLSGNYRYMLSDTSQGELSGSYLRDKEFAGQSRLNRYRSLQNQGEILDRWYVSYSHYYDLPDNYVSRLQVQNASDLQYISDFPIETQSLGEPAMETRASITKNNDNQHWSIDTSYYKNLMQSNPLANNSETVHRFPEIRFSQVSTRIQDTDLLFKFDFQYLNLARTSLPYDNLVLGPDNKKHVSASGTSQDCTKGIWETNPDCQLSRDGKYDPEIDIIRTGQRLDFRPSISQTIKIKNLEVVPTASYRETQYLFPIGLEKTSFRRYLRADVSARSSFSKVFGDLNTLKGDRIKHEVQPEVTFTSVPWIYNPKHPFFGETQETNTSSNIQTPISDADISGSSGLQFDYDDRVTTRELVTVGLVNKLTSKVWVDGTARYRQFLIWKLGQAYDSGRPLADLYSELKLNMDHVSVYQKSNYFHLQQVANTSTRVRVLNSFGDFIELEHNLTNEITTGQSTVRYEKRTEDISPRLLKRYKYIDLVAKFTYDLNPPSGGQRYKSYGIGTQVRLPGDCWYINMTQFRPFTGREAFRFNFGFIWDGTSSLPLTEAALSAFGI